MKSLVTLVLAASAFLPFTASAADLIALRELSDPCTTALIKTGQPGELHLNLASDLVTIRYGSNGEPTSFVMGPNTLGFDPGRVWSIDFGGGEDQGTFRAFGGAAYGATVLVRSLELQSRRSTSFLSEEVVYAGTDQNSGARVEVSMSVGATGDLTYLNARYKGAETDLLSMSRGSLLRSRASFRWIGDNHMPPELSRLVSNLALDFSDGNSQVYNGEVFRNAYYVCGHEPCALLPNATPAQIVDAATHIMSMERFVHEDYDRPLSSLTYPIARRFAEWVTTVVEWQTPTQPKALATQSDSVTEIDVSAKLAAKALAPLRRTTE